MVFINRWFKGYLKIEYLLLEAFAQDMVLFAEVTV